MNGQAAGRLFWLAGLVFVWVSEQVPGDLVFGWCEITADVACGQVLPRMAFSSARREDAEPVCMQCAKARL